MAQIYGRKLNQTAHEMNRAIDTFAHTLGTTGVQLSILDFVATTTSAPIQRDVEREFNIQRPTATVLLQRMVRDGLIVRTPSADDARQKLIELTPRGRELAAHAAKFIGKQQAAVTNHFSTAELATFENVLEYFKGLQ
ncbi:MarR family winged helix-turn-helix transcriptional regulator [Lacticaseibacillus hulanensis]|uniref:MarR family winged helix-turn-helix transcriptional regulator n=1 Tax=Lacticaseibacillus hulanensis TaxID=2493111 RepID=UPI000FD9D380|nr:MarR family winged helix-turn-helix transcriptional regulator [Lacticaseibacillus hulanensis]